MSEASGPEAVPVSRSRARGRVAATPIRATFGLPGSSSFASAGLTACLVNRLKQRLGAGGSIVFRQTWREKATPSGRLYWAHTASARSTSDSGSGSWPTPNTPSGGRSMSIEKMDATGRTADGRKHTASLEHAVKFASWPTPKVVQGDYQYSQGDHARPVLNLSGVAKLASWATPTTRDHKDGAENQNVPENALLGRQAWQAAWATPRAEDSESTGAHRGIADTLTSQSRLSGLTPTGSPAVTASHGQLNAAHSRWLQGYPRSWDACAIWARRSMPPRRA